VDTSSDAANELSAGRTDLAIVRADVGNLADARTIVLVTHGVVMIAVPADSPVDSIDKLKGKTVGVLGAQINHVIVEAIQREYDLVNQKVEFKDIALADIPKALQAKQVSAVPWYCR
jgi:ABC-type nitrate/sulfonate/bicarbonate transport system substrate-binding protein